MEQFGFEEARREQLSFLAKWEKRCLIWIAHRLPPWVNSDHLTLLGIAALLGAGLSYWYARRHPAGLLIATGCLIVNWFGDSCDGTLARVRNRQRPRYGFYVDPIVDAFGTFFLMGGLGLSGYMSPAISMGLLIAYFMLSIEVYLATYTIGAFHLSFWKFSPTELRILLAAGNLAVFLRGPAVDVAGRSYLLFDIGGLVGICGMALMLITAVIRHVKALYDSERLP